MLFQKACVSFAKLANCVCKVKPHTYCIVVE